MSAKPSQDQLHVPVESLIITLRGQRVILDSDLARIYGVKTGALNRAVKRNLGRFPEDFVFQLTAEETSALRCQPGISKQEADAGLMKAGRGGRRYLPSVFTEHGALMAANVLDSPLAVQMSVFVVRAFIRMRATLADTRELARKLADLERDLKARLDVHESAIVGILQRVMEVLAPPALPARRPRRRIGFGVKEAGPRYRVRQLAGRGRSR
jgi:hypothetical protein